MSTDWGQVYALKYKDMVRLAKRYLRTVANPHELAEEVVSRAFLECCDPAQDRYDPARSSPETWLWALVRKHAQRVRRQEHARIRKSCLLTPEITNHLPAPSPTPPWEVNSVHWKGIPPAQRRAVEQVVMRRRELRDVAREEGITHQGMAWRAKRGLKLLKPCLTEERAGV